MDLLRNVSLRLGLGQQELGGRGIPGLLLAEEDRTTAQRVMRWRLDGRAPRRAAPRPAPPPEGCCSSSTPPSAISARRAGDGLATALEGIAASLSGGASLNSKEILRSIGTLARTSSAQHVLDLLRPVVTALEIIRAAQDDLTDLSFDAYKWAG